jgi:hypothetical protein
LAIEFQPLYAIDYAELSDDRVDVRLTVVGGDSPVATRTFDRDAALYGGDGGEQLSDWIWSVVRDLYASGVSYAQKTDSLTRWSD